jgi:putative transposase
MIQVQLKLRPTKAQERTFGRWLWHLGGVWNWSVKKLQREPLRLYDLKSKLKGHSKKVGVPAVAMLGTAATAHEAWTRHRRGLARRPHLKGRRRPLSSIAFDHWDMRLKGRRIHVPVLGYVRFHHQEIPAGHIGQARIVRRASGWYVCLFVHAEPIAIEPMAHGEIGIDPGFSSLLTLSTGEKIEHPREFERAEQRLGQAQRGHRRQLTARMLERIRNRRKNRHHHLSRRLVAENSLIAFSADPHHKIARSFGKSVASSGHYELRQQLAYKSLAGGRQYVEVPSRNSTRACSACGALTGPTGWRGLKVRQWVCTTCGVEHDRDCNAAVNTLIAGRGARHESGREAASGTASEATRRCSLGRG